MALIRRWRRGWRGRAFRGAAGGAGLSAGSLEPLEPRMLMSAAVVTPIQDVAIGGAGGHDVADLATVFNDTEVIGTVVRLESVLGAFHVELFDGITPITVANFLDYVNDGDYNHPTSGDTFIHRSAQNFVVQGGGFRWDGSGVNDVPTEPPIANEFAQLRSHFGANAKINTRGRIAMAKQGGDPNSATSQWFVNLADNSANLDSQNGGFTSFGRVLYGGMTVVDAIAAVPRHNKSDLDPAFDTIPLIGYTSGPVQTSNLVRFTDIAVVDELTFAVENDRPDLVDVSIVDGKLHVASSAATAGRASVTVTATDTGGHTERETFEVNVLLPSVAQIADVAVAENAQSGQAVFGVTLSHAPVDQPVTMDYAIVGGTAAAGEDFAGPLTGTLTIPAGSTSGSVTVNLTNDTKVEFNETVLVNFSNVSANATLADTQAVATLDDDESTERVIDAANPVSFTDADSDRVTLSVRGVGTGTVATPNESTAGEAMVRLSGTTARTRLTISARGGDGRTGIGGVDVDGPLRQLSAGDATLTGPLRIGGAIGAIHLLAVGDAGSVSLGTGPADTDGTLFRVADDFAGSLTTPSLARLLIGGDLSGADVDLTGPFDPARVSLIRLRVGGAIDGTTIDSVGNLGAVTAGAMRRSRIFAGINPAVATLPHDATDFVQLASIRSVTLTGIAGDPLETFIGSHIAADTIGGTSLGTVNPANDAQPFGLATRNIRGPLTWRIGAAPFTVRTPADLAGVAFDDDFIVRLV